MLRIVHIFLILFPFTIFAQKSVVVQQGDTPHVFDNLPEAIDFASDGDQVYISGGSFDLDGTLTIDKQLEIYGVGYKDESVESTGRTHLVGVLQFNSGSSGSLLHGFYLTANIAFSSEDTLSSITISRCSFNSLFAGSLQNSIFQENEIRSDNNGQESDNILFVKNILRRKNFNYQNSIFRNNFFVYIYNYSGSNYSTLRAIHSIINCNFESNIFRGTYVDNYLGSLASNSTFSHNWFQGNVQSGVVGTNVTVDNFGGYDDSFFVDYPNKDYHLSENSPGSNAGSDGTDVGIYGTSEPFKENALPVNPHIVSKLFSIEDNVLQINIEVEAQRE